jgi:holo-[acyl-carrier protein] synthase
MRIGCDVVDVARFALVLERRAQMRRRLFTPHELRDAVRGGVDVGSQVEIDRLAARFAAKEAARKALRNLRMPFHDTEVRITAGGAPMLWIGGAPSQMSVSMSHDAGIAMAVVVGPPDADGHAAVALPDVPDPPGQPGSTGPSDPPDLPDHPPAPEGNTP